MPGGNSVDIDTVNKPPKQDRLETRLQKSKQTQISDHIFQIQKARRVLGLVLNPPTENIKLQCLDIVQVSEEEWDLNYNCLFESKDFDSDSELLVRLRGTERLNLRFQRLDSLSLVVTTYPKRFPNRTLAQYDVTRTWRVLKQDTDKDLNDIYTVEHRWLLSPLASNRTQHMDLTELNQRLNFVVSSEDRKVKALGSPIESNLRFDWRVTNGKKIEFHSGMHRLSSDAPALFQGSCSWPVGDWEFDINVDQETKKRKGALRISEQSMIDRKTGKRWSASQNCFSENGMDWIDF